MVFQPKATTAPVKAPTVKAPGSDVKPSTPDVESALLLTWPAPTLAIFTPDMLELETSKVTNGIQSHLMMIMKVLNLSRDDALQHITQMAQDDADVKALYPEMAAVTGLPDPDPGPAGDEANPNTEVQERNDEISP